MSSFVTKSKPHVELVSIRFLFMSMHSRLIPSVTRHYIPRSRRIILRAFCLHVHAFDSSLQEYVGVAPKKNPRCSLRREFAEPKNGGHSAVHVEVAAGDPPFGPMSNAATVPTSSGVPARPAADNSNMRR